MEQTFIPTLLLVLGVGLSLLSSNEIYKNYMLTSGKTPVLEREKPELSVKIEDGNSSKEPMSPDEGKGEEGKDLPTIALKEKADDLPTIALKEKTDDLPTIALKEKAEVLPTKVEKEKADLEKAEKQKVQEECSPTFTILFDRDTHFSSTAKKTISDVVGWLRTRPYKNIVVQGHADGTGNENFNLKLSHRRAKKVAVVLEKKGISSKQITVQAFGEYQPVAGQNKKNRLRRVVVKVVGQTPCEEKE